VPRDPAQRAGHLVLVADDFAPVTVAADVTFAVRVESDHARRRPSERARIVRADVPMRDEFTLELRP
jgi:hypothetical protein